MLGCKSYLFDEAVNINYTNAAEIDNKISQLTDLIYETSYSVFRRTVTVDNRKAPDGPKEAPWFDEDCRATKAFFNAKRAFKGSTSTEASKVLLLEARKKYSLVKR